jgi:hypothetical protein
MVSTKTRLVAGTDRLKAVQAVLSRSVMLPPGEELDGILDQHLTEIAEIVSDYTCPTLNVQFSATPSVRLAAIGSHVKKGLDFPIQPWDRKVQAVESALAEIVRWSTVNYGS